MNSTNLMGQLTSLAGRYAKTLFELAKEGQKLPLIAQQYIQFIDFLNDHENLEHILLSPSLTRQEQESLFSTFAQNLKFDRLLERFFELLADNRRLNHLRDIQVLFQALCDQEEHIQQVDVISAYPLTKTQQKSLTTVLSKKIPRELSMTFIQDPSVLAGIFIRFGNQVIDLTLLNQLHTLTHAMKGSAS